MDKAAIICIDDDRVILESLGEQLNRTFGKDYDIEVACSGQEALELLAELELEGIQVPLIISDQLMSGMQGDELLIEIHERYPKTLKILLTGQASVKVVGNIINAANLYRYITKPWDETDLILTVKEALRRYTQEQQLDEQNQALKKINEELEKSLSLLSATLEATADGILVIDGEGKIASFNQKFLEMWHIPDSIVASRDDNQALAFVLEQLKEPNLFIAKVQELYAEPEAESYDLLEFKNGRIFERYSQPQKLGREIVGRVWSFRDITERKLTEQKIEHQAFHDALTNLPNRMLFNQKLANALAESHLTQSKLAVMFLDLDRFKIVNDTLGHAIGDRLLQSVVERLHKCLRSEDLISRWGGDEFTLLLPHINCPEDAFTIAERILKVLQPSFNIEGHPIHVTSSIGIAVYPDDGSDVETLLKNADAALYRVKDKGRNGYQQYTLTSDSQAYELLALENSLHYALEKKEFSLYYQPQIDTSTGKIVQMEALLRWHHSDLGLVSPAKFIPLAEENGSIVEIGEWVLETACAQNKAWQAMGLPPISVAVNLSARQLQNSNLVQTVKQILQQTELDPRFLDLEITETIAMQNLDLTKSILNDLNLMGVSLSLDDFGTGYSSLNYLKQFPFHTLKIDQSFVKDLGKNPKDTAIVNAIIALARGLNLRVVAEGVETQTLKDLLKSLECQHMQGYFFSRPLSEEAATELLKKSY